MSLPSDLTPVLDALGDEARSALGGQLVGGYLVGSWALGCGDEWSDVDVVLVVDGAPAPDAEAGLRRLHARLPDAGGWAAHLEVSYADAADLRSPMTVGRRWWYVDNGSRELVRSAHDNTAHTRWVLREHGVVLTGPPPADLVTHVPPEALRAEALGAARERAEALEADPDALANAWFQPYSVLTSCRILRTAARADVVGKTEAARWALAELPELDAVHRPLVERAIADRPHPWERVHQRADPTLAAPTRALVWDVVRLAGALALAAR